MRKLFARGEGDSGGHVLRETTSRGVCGLVCPSRTSERGGEGDCVKEEGRGEGERDWERALGRLRETTVAAVRFKFKRGPRLNLRLSQKWRAGS